MWEFLVGVGACLFTRSSLHKSIRIRSALQRIGVIVILLVASSTNEGIPKWSTPNIMVVFVTAFILIVGTCESQTPTRFNILEWKPLVWIGDRSYGWYLWHWPFIVFSSRLFPASQTTTFIASIVALIPAAISFRWIESPLRNWAPPRSVTIVKRISLITFPVFLIVVISHTWITPLIESNSGGYYSYSVEGCETSNKPCVINIDEATETILLEGDSHALSLSNTVLQIAKEKQSNLVVCIRQCIDSNPIEVLVKDYSITSIISMRQYQAIPGKTFDELINFAKSNSELNTVLLADNPRIKGFWQPPTLLGKKARTVSLQFVLEQQQDSIKLLTEIDKSVPNITVIPTLDFICFDQLCPIKLSGKFIYSDDNHLSVTGAALLYQPILEALNKK
jgi:hypothetical protein